MPRSKDPKINRLARLPLFRACHQDELRWIASVAEEVEVPAGARQRHRYDAVPTHRCGGTPVRGTRRADPYRVAAASARACTARRALDA